ncbi:hypothetical protein ACJJTC_004119 [Scirpophaga incertulas]
MGTAPEAVAFPGREGANGEDVRHERAGRLPHGHPPGAQRVPAAQENSNQNYIHMLSEDYVIMGLGGVQFLTAALVGWWGRRSRRLALVGWLVAAAAAALLVLALPFDEDNPTTVELCSNEPVLELSRYSREANTSVVPALRTSMLVLTLALCSLAKVSVWAHGYTLLHDAQPHNAPHFYGEFSSSPQLQ